MVLSKNPVTVQPASAPEEFGALVPFSTAARVRVPGASLSTKARAGNQPAKHTRCSANDMAYFFSGTYFQLTAPLFTSATQ